MEPIDLGGYEGHFYCPACEHPIDIKQGNSGDVFTCDPSLGCGAEWELYARRVDE